MIKKPMVGYKTCKVCGYSVYVDEPRKEDKSIEGCVIKEISKKFFIGGEGWVTVGCPFQKKIILDIHP